MTSSQKLVLIVLILLAVAFAVGVGPAFLSDSGHRDNKLTREQAIDQAKGLQNSWVGSLADALDFLIPGLDVKRLTSTSACRKGQGSFHLTDDTPCLIQISNKKGGNWDWMDFEKMVLTADSGRVSLQVCRCERPTGPLPRGGEMRVSPGKLVKFRDRLRPPLHGGIGTVVQKRPEVTAAYFPKGEAVTSGCASGEMLVCEEVEAVSAVILEDGGTLRLTCEGCTAANPAVLTLK